ncbi:SCO family protein [Sphingomonas sp. MAH-20]|uniref:SCO family protein n=1 Tax=Sphingomonas horti TaxID=2682842 RepID=A0A6I4IXQ8_9SPHN|nr:MULTISPECIES: SCO family protein [Sphingomonas]MBA2920909.1 SCO family protein [Sphingomonas sp. CGMCC 1.13658]MVO76895.1 SCO family protein [Sphingomonas horti]
MTFHSLLLALPLVLAACGQSAPPPSEAPLAGARIGGPFTLVNQDGRQVSDRDFAGRYRLMYFGYTYCPDVCPVDLQRLMAGYKLLEGSEPAVAAKIAPIFVSVDPERDTPAVLKQYVTAFSPKLTGLTGSPEQIAKVAKDYAIVYSKEERPGASDYLMNHSRVAYLFGPDGKPIALIPQDGTPEAIAAELKRWVR